MSQFCEPLMLDVELFEIRDPQTQENFYSPNRNH
ncbi:hypothetical protein ES703_61412 [subsurface metagenome]